jgi:hypothetical protein
MKKRLEPTKGKGKGKRIAGPPPVAELPPQQQTPTFCLHYLHKDFCLLLCTKDEKAGFADTLHQLSQLTWAQIAQAPRKGLGYEIIPQEAIRAGLPPQVTKEVKILAFRFFGNATMVGYREGRLFHVLFLDREFKLYDHGS